jgi:FMN reductase
VYANDSDFTNYRVSSLELHERIDQAVGRALPLIRAGAVEIQSITS